SGYNITDNVDPIINVSYPVNYTNYNSNVVKINYTVNGTGTQVSIVNVSVDGTVVSQFENGGVNSSKCIIIDPSQELWMCSADVNMVHGNHIIFIDAYDFGVTYPGNNANATLYITTDTDDPVVNLLGPSDSIFTTVDQPTFNFEFTDTLSENASCTLWIDGVGLDMNASTPNATNTTLVANTSLSEGLHSWTVNCTDLSGNEGTAVPRTITVDTNAPVVNLISPDADNLTTGSPTMIFNFTDALSSTASCSLLINGTEYGTNAATANASSTSITASPALASGSYAWTVNCTDGAGNEGTVAERPIHIDADVPLVTLISPAAGVTVSNDAPTFTFNLTDELSSTASCVLYVGATSYGMNGTAPNATEINITANASISDGTYTWKIECSEASGGIGSATRTITIDAVPDYYGGDDDDDDSSTHSGGGALYTGNGAAGPQYLFLGTMDEGDKAKLEWDGNSYVMLLVEVTTENVLISFDGYRDFTVILSEYIDLDINSDGINDIIFKAGYVDDNTATILVKKAIVEEAVEAPPAEEPAPVPAAEPAPVAEPEVPEEEIILEEPPSKFNKLLLGLLALVIVAVVAIVFIMRSRKGPGLGAQHGKMEHHLGKPEQPGHGHKTEHAVHRPAEHGHKSHPHARHHKKVEHPLHGIGDFKERNL
ncbi:Ig-like domain-containing protein, partial [Thermoproteota archaeon]